MSSKDFPQAHKDMHTSKYIVLFTGEDCLKAVAWVHQHLNITVSICNHLSDALFSGGKRRKYLQGIHLQRAKWSPLSGKTNAESWKRSNISSSWSQIPAPREKMLKNKLFPIFQSCWLNMAIGDAFKPPASSYAHFWNHIVLLWIIPAKIFWKRNKSENI